MQDVIDMQFAQHYLILNALHDYANVSFGNV